MDPAQQRTRGRRRRAAGRGGHPAGSTRGRGDGPYAAGAPRGAGLGLPKAGGAGSPLANTGQLETPQNSHGDQRKSRDSPFRPPERVLLGGGRPSGSGRVGGGRSGPLSGSPRPRAGQERGQRSRRPYLRRRARGKAPPGFPPPAPGGFEVSLRPRPAPMSDSAPGGPAGHLGARRLRRTRPGRALPAAFPPVPPPPPHPCRYVSVAPPSRDTPPAGHGRSSQAAWRLHPSLKTRFN